MLPGFFGGKGDSVGFFCKKSPFSAYPAPAVFCMIKAERYIAGKNLLV